MAILKVFKEYVSGIYCTDDAIFVGQPYLAVRCGARIANDNSHLCLHYENRVWPDDEKFADRKKKSFPC